MENNLKSSDKFKKILSDYQISEHGKKILREVRLVILSGLSSSGRNTVIKELCKSGNYHFIISNTTRKPRINDGVMEQNGVEYWFRSEDRMLKDLMDGEMLEAEIIHAQQVSGISISELERAKNEGRIAITDMEIGGFKNVLKEKPDTLAVVLLPPSFKEWQKRMNNRGKMSDIEKRRRLHTATRVLADAISMPEVTLVVNHDFHETVKLFHSIENHSIDQAEARTIANKLLSEIQNYLKT